MQEIGLLYALRPIVSVLHPDRDEQVRVLKGYSGFFNTNPYLSGTVLGLLVQAEGKEKETAELVRQIRASWMGPLAAIGDAMFWQTLRPCLGWLAAVFALIQLRPQGGGDIALAPLLFLIPYNLVQGWVRLAGFRFAYVYGPELVAVLSRLRLQQRLRSLRALGVCFAGAGAAALAVHGRSTGTFWHAWWLLGGHPTFLQASWVLAACLGIFAIARWFGRVWIVCLTLLALASFLAWFGRSSEGF